MVSQSLLVLFLLLLNVITHHDCSSCFDHPANTRFILPGAATRFSSVRLTAHFDFGMRIPSMDDAGVGLQLDASLFERHKLRPLITTHIEKMLGDKLYISPDIGRRNKSNTVYGLQAGPEYLISPALAFSFQYGVFFHAVNEEKFNADDGYRMAMTVMPGKRNRTVIQFSRTEVPRGYKTIRYHTIGLGYRF